MADAGRSRTVSREPAVRMSAFSPSADTE
jgi:hypothetical protein